MSDEGMPLDATGFQAEQRLREWDDQVAVSPTNDRVVSMTTPDNEARTILGEAIRACNALIIHLNNHPDTFPAGIRQAMIEADYMLNSAACDVADFVGEFPPPTATELAADAEQQRLDGIAWMREQANGNLHDRNVL